eukprot:TRINITY_DN30878_c0_g1_i1.p1 TRINITY_DN30878_c0_g1~~TRINITY_DN30878_c0_g1_i1.p1  ORF type:complete len:862 (+),score=110.97 TRINITY_DN30878_c0_g1_i1:74-2659(+)
MAEGDASSCDSLSSLWARVTEGLDQVNSSVAELEKCHGELFKKSPPEKNSSEETPAALPAATLRMSDLFGDICGEEDVRGEWTTAKNSRIKGENRLRSVTLDLGEEESAGDVVAGASLRRDHGGSQGVNSKRGSLEIRKVHTQKSGMFKNSSSLHELGMNSLWHVRGSPWGTNGDDFTVTQNSVDDYVADKFGKYLTQRETVGRKASVSSFWTSNFDPLVETGKKDETFRCQAVHPHSRFRLCWDVLSVLGVSLELFILPLVLAFEVGENLPVSIVDWITAVFWTMDMVASCITGYHVGPNVETDLRSVSRHYLMTWFVLDIVIVGSEWYGKIAEGNLGLSAFRASRIMRMLRILRCVRLVKLYQTLNKIQDVTSSAQLVILFSVAKMSAALMYVVHILACGWYLTGRIDHLGGERYDHCATACQGGDGGKVQAQGWVLVAEERIGMDALSLTWGYITSLRWTLSQLNGRTDREDRPIIEMVYTSVTATFTLLFMSIFVGSMTSRMLQLQQLIDKESGYLRILKKYTESNELTWKTIYIARRHIRDRWTWENNTNIESTLLNLLPAQTQLDLLFEVRTPVMSAHPFFRLLCSEFAQAIRETLSMAVVSESARSMETIFEKSEQLSRFIFITDGTLLYSRNPGVKHWLTYRDIEERAEMNMSVVKSMKNILRGSSKFVSNDKLNHSQSGKGCNLCKGKWVCEASLWSHHWYTQGVLISTSHSKLVSIGRDEFAKVMLRHADAHAVCNYYARGFIRQLQESNARNHEMPSDTFTTALRDAFGVTQFDTRNISTESSQHYALVTSGVSRIAPRDSRMSTDSLNSADSSLPERYISHSSRVAFDLPVADSNMDSRKDDQQFKFSL